jgi:hypothetical protein
MVSDAYRLGDLYGLIARIPSTWHSARSLLYRGSYDHLGWLASPCRASDRLTQQNQEENNMPTFKVKMERSKRNPVAASLRNFDAKVERDKRNALKELHFLQDFEAYRNSDATYWHDEVYGADSQPFDDQQ